MQHKLSENSMRQKVKCYSLFRADRLHQKRIPMNTYGGLNNYIKFLLTLCFYSVLQNGDFTCLKLELVQLSSNTYLTIFVRNLPGSPHTGRSILISQGLTGSRRHDSDLFMKLLEGCRVASLDSMLSTKTDRLSQCIQQIITQTKGKHALKARDSGVSLT